MEYNTQRPQLALPEYGRNVQNMIAYAMELPTKDERNSAARAIIEVMGQLNPHLRDVDDFKSKLWTHLFVMSDFKLDVDSPYEIPSQETLSSKPELMEYPKGKITYGHYGKYTEKIIHKIANMDNELDRQFYKDVIANFMKKQFLVYNNNTVENHVIADQLEELSKGALTLTDPNDSLQDTRDLLKSIGINPNNNHNGKNKFKKQNQKNNKFKKKR
ncbi:MAG TPA: DUF4290 domain-containing protein [Crocinitomicaceae bacterium]|nr:DUF4290 domain-containing protein [Crocinitomicaceae bacterium]